jgi:hypothetical protein
LVLVGDADALWIRLAGLCRPCGLGIVLLLTSHPPLDFFSAVALVLPVLFLAAMVETRFSAAVPPLKEEEESEDRPAARVLAFLFAVEALAVGELGSLDALWHGAGSGIDGPVALAGLVILGVVLVWPLVDRMKVDVKAGGEERAKRVRLRVRRVGSLLAIFAVGLLIGGRL